MFIFLGINYCFGNGSDIQQSRGPKECANCTGTVFIYEYDEEFGLATYTCVGCGFWFVEYDE